MTYSEQTKETSPASYIEKQVIPAGTVIDPTPVDYSLKFVDPDYKTPTKVPKLYQPLKIRNVTIKNRIWVSPMCMYSAKDGFANDFHLVHLGQFALHGAGLVMMEATGVSPNGRITPGCTGIWKDEHIPQLQKITNFIHSQESVAAIQIAHAGRKASTNQPWTITSPDKNKADTDKGGWPEDIVAPSAISYDKNHWTPKELTIQQIQDIKNDFINAAKRADQAGFDVIEIHGAHGYLISEFLSPVSNFRTDQYGGKSLENRARLLVEIVQGIRKVIPQTKPLFVRLSCTEWVESTNEVPTGGNTIKDTIEISKILAQEGVDLIDCSSGGNHPNQKISPGPGYQVFLSDELRQANPQVLTGAVGIIVNGKQANQIVEEGKADAVFIGRQFLRDPTFALNAAEDLDLFVKWPSQYTFGRKKRTSKTVKL
ncbi:hypothetical protein H4219_005731 [Mycoemilia scoparia]|uniref:NADH:flavin oxidoreductase/NADH oxidase N-terminal domain-containing protein n=1 Tax=Mycoemilia scoparia TaxID=417184 RepID=A0A9W7ZS21_9FUNG|nr:hypothetical protein H4219_005731 [Mycoemilia scoparia]